MFPTSVCYFSQLLAAKHAFLRSCRIWIRTGTKCFRVLVWVTRRTAEGSHRSHTKHETLAIRRERL